MEGKEERLVARLRHHNPNLTVTELHIGQVDRDKKALVIDYINSLKLNGIVESSPGLETVVSVDISSRTEQDEIFKKLLDFIREIGIGEISITSEPFDEQQPEIDSTGSIPVVRSSSRELTPLNSDDIEELISRDKSESEFELILSQPRRSSSRDSRWLHCDQSSRDVIGSLLKFGEGIRSQSSEWSLIHSSINTHNRASKNLKLKSYRRIQTLWSRAKKLFKKRKKKPKQANAKFQIMVSQDSIHTEGGKSKDQSKKKDHNTQRNITTVNNPNQVSLNILQKRLEKVSRDVFSMKHKCPGMNRDVPSLDVYTQTQEKSVIEGNLKNKKILTVDKNCSGIESTIRKHCTTHHSNVHTDTKSLSAMSTSSSSTESENRFMNAGMKFAPQYMRGMVTNLIPVYPNLPADLKRPVMCELKPVGGPFFFRRITSTKTSSHSTATSFLTTASNSIKSTRSTITFSSLSCPSINQEPYLETRTCDLENVLYNHLGNQYLSCGIVSTTNDTPFEREKLKKTQTVNPPLKTTEINTTGKFKLPKETQTRPKKKKKVIPPTVKKGPSIGTQTACCSTTTSCTELLHKKSCGTKTENEVEKVDKENSCYLLTKQETETKETSRDSETIVPKCEACLCVPNKQVEVEKKKKPTGKQKNERAPKRGGFIWGQYPDGNYGFGQRYAPGKVFPVISMATGFSNCNPFNVPQKVTTVGNQACPKICNMFGGKKKALLDELNKQKIELMQMRMVLVAINEELLAECTDTSSEDNFQSSDDNYQSTDTQATLKQSKKVTFSDPLVNERTLNYPNH